MSDTAVKLDTGKRKLSLIHPSTMAPILRKSIHKPIAMAMCNLSEAAHAKTVEEIAEFARMAEENIVEHMQGMPDAALEELAMAMEYGEKKYGRNNWKKGMEWSRLIDAALRHGLASMGRQKTDEESGNTHAAHMLASVHMLLGNIALNVGTNDIC